MRQHLIAYLLLSLPVAFTLRGAGGSGDITSLVQERRLPLVEARTAITDHQPALMPLRDSVSLSRVEVTADYSHSKRAVMLQEGAGHMLGTLNTESYMHLDRRNIVWGHATYTAGREYDLSWANCVDYRLVAPYVLGDSVGGDLQQRIYNIGGGWAGQTGAWSYGAEANYRALIGYRNIDPRVKDIVSDLSLTLSGARKLGMGYTLGVSASARIYHQDCDLDFYNPLNDIDTYPLTGLGTYNQRFMGNTNKSSGHKLTGWSGRITLFPDGGDGFAASIGTSVDAASLQLRNFNNISLGTTSTLHIDGKVMWTHRFSPAVTFQPSIEGLISGRKGRESLFGSATSGSYEKIGDRDVYRHDILSLRLELPVQLNLAPRRYLTASVGGDFYDSSEKILLTTRHSEVTLAGVHATVSYTSPLAAKWMFDLGATASATKRLDSSIDTGEALKRFGPAEAMVYNHRMASCNRWGVVPHATFMRGFGAMSAGVTVAAILTDYRGQFVKQNYAITLNLTF